jgi:hypothetical protein
LKNGELLQAAEQEGFAVFATTDTKLKYQQNLQRRRIAIVALSTTSWPRIAAAAHLVRGAVENAAPEAMRRSPFPDDGPRCCKRAN